MKAALVSATSLAALLAFEVGLDVAIDAHPASAQTFSVSPGNTNFGVVLLNSPGPTSFSVGETITNETSAKNTITIPAFANDGFSDAALHHVFGTNTSGASTTTTYTFAPTTIGAYAANVTVTSTITANSGNGNQATLSLASFALSGTAVAPQESTSGASIINLGTVRAGTTIAAITVSNIGNGDLYSSSLAAAQLQVSLGASNSVFTPAVNAFSLNDKSYAPTNGGISVSAPIYVFAPTVHGVGENTTATISFLNGGSNTNTTASALVTLSATGIGPVFKGVYNSSIYTNATAVGTSVNNAGNIALGTQNHGATTTFTITVSNASTDTPSGSLTNLTLNGFTLGTCSAVNCTYDDFKVLSFVTTPDALGEGNSVTMTLDFSGGLQTYYNADLTFATDQGAATGVGGTGAYFSYLLTANIPEPATIITFGMGLAGLGWARRRRATRRTTIGTDASPA